MNTFQYNSNMAKKTEAASMIVQSGEPVLHMHAKPVLLKQIGSKELNKVLSDMNQAVEYESDGVAIAAPQIGIPLRIFIISKKAFLVDDVKKNGEEKDIPVRIPKNNLVFINPEITKLSRKKVKVPEGCLSVRWLYGNTIRHEKATVRAYDEHGKRFTYGGSGLIAQIFQHETDHLNGILFVDHATDIEELTAEQIEDIQKKNSKR